MFTWSSQLVGEVRHYLGRVITIIKTFYYNPQSGAGKNNFGEAIISIIIKWISGHDIKYVPATTKGKLLCIGSELGQGVVQEGDIIWGYGAKHARPIKIPRNVSVLAVRGYWTKDLIDVSVDVVGDPGTLLPLIYTPEVEKEYVIGVIPHYIDKNQFSVSNDILNIDITSDPFDIIDNINRCEVIISTSMHGAIAAESYGIPVVWLQVSDKIRGVHFKWNDYISSSGREEQSPIKLFKTIKDEDLIDIKDQCLPQPESVDPYRLVNAWHDHFNIV